MITAGEKVNLTIQAMRDVLAERERQNEKWGEQNHPDGTGVDLFVLAPIMRQLQFEPGTAPAGALATAATEATDLAAIEGIVDWADILLEEVFEALAEDDVRRLRTELIQVAAVAMQWAEAIDRRAGA